MASRSHAPVGKVKMTFECTPEERTYIKILAAKAQLTLSEFLLSHLRNDFPRKPNKETLAAINELEDGHLIACESIDDFWDQMGVKPSAET